MLNLTTLFHDAVHLFYPHNCIGCGSDLLSKNEQLCIKCISDLPHTRYELHKGNPVEKIFWGRINLQAGHGEFYFSKGQLIQHLMHQLKYKGNKNVGEYLGNMMGKSLLQSGRFSHVDYLVPLPLFPEKEFKRGYNQAEIICNGISETMNLPVITKNLTRQRSTETQTKKHRTERWQNVEGSFAIKNPSAFENKNILLVDDVLTTGATFEAACQPFLQIPNVGISIGTLAIASK